ncbi:hypothetical protein [Providencia heimbachae]
MADVQLTKQILDQLSNMLQVMLDMQSQITKLRERIDKLEKEVADDNT